MYEKEQMTSNQIAKKLNLSLQTVRKYLGFDNQTGEEPPIIGYRQDTNWVGMSLNPGERELRYVHERSNYGQNLLNQFTTMFLGLESKTGGCTDPEEIARDYDVHTPAGLAKLQLDYKRLWRINEEHIEAQEDIRGLRDEIRSARRMVGRSSRRAF